MSAEPETTLAWAEFLWRVAKEAPEVASLYIALFLYWQHTRKAKGRIIHLELSDTLALSDSVTVEPTPAILSLSPARGTGSASVALTTGNDAGTQAVLDQMAEVFPYEFPPN
jgi:hypothetical protein